MLFVPCWYYFSIIFFIEFVGYYSDGTGLDCMQCDYGSRSYSVAGSSSCLVCPTTGIKYFSNDFIYYLGYDYVNYYNCTKSVDAIWSIHTGSTAVAAYYIGSFVNSTKAYFVRAQNSVVDIFDVALDRFDLPIANNAPVGATQRVYPGMATVNDYYSIIAGGITSGEFNTSADIFHIPTSTITSIDPFLSAARFKIAAVSVLDLVIFFGGQDASTYFSNFEIFNITNFNISTGFLSNPRTDISTASLNELAFFAGGFNNAIESEGLKYSNTTDIYNARLNSWSTHVSSTRRCNITSVGVGNYAIFAGGRYCTSDGCEYLNLVEKYNYLTSTWSSFAMKTYRANMGVAAAFGKAFFVGGLGYGNLYGSGTQNSIEIFDSLADTWYLSYSIIIGDSSYTRYAISSAVIFSSQANIIFAGGLDSSGYPSFSHNWDVITVGCNFGYYISGSSCFSCSNGKL